MQVTCSVCHGDYFTPSADGTFYKHTCPPLSDAEVGRLLELPDDSGKWSDADRVAVAAHARERGALRDPKLDRAPAPAVDAPPS